VEALLRMRGVTRERRAQVIGRGGVEISPAAGWILSDEHGVGEEHALTGWRLSLECHQGFEISLVEPVEVDLEDATHVRLIVGVVVEIVAIDLDGSVVSIERVVSRARERCDRQQRNGQGD